MGWAIILFAVLCFIAPDMIMELIRFCILFFLFLWLIAWFNDQPMHEFWTKPKQETKNEMHTISR